MFTGPHTITDGLVFGYHAHEINRFFYAEPTINLNPYPTNSNRTNGEVVSIYSWGGDTGTGRFLQDTSLTQIDGLLFELNNTTIDDEAGSGAIHYSTTYFTLTSGVTYTRSWYIKSDIPQTISGHICSCNKHSDNTYLVGPDIYVSNEWRRYSHTFTYSEQTASDWCFRHINYHTSNIHISNIHRFT